MSPGEGSCSGGGKERRVCPLAADKFVPPRFGSPIIGESGWKGCSHADPACQTAVRQPEGQGEGADWAEPDSAEEEAARFLHGEL